MPNELSILVTVLQMTKKEKKKDTFYGLFFIILLKPSIFLFVCLLDLQVLLKIPIIAAFLSIFSSFLPAFLTVFDVMFST